MFLSCVYLCITHTASPPELHVLYTQFPNVLRAGILSRGVDRDNTRATTSIFLIGQNPAPAPHTHILRTPSSGGHFYKGQNPAFPLPSRCKLTQHILPSSLHPSLFCPPPRLSLFPPACSFFISPSPKSQMSDGLTRICRVQTSEEESDGKAITSLLFHG